MKKYFRVSFIFILVIFVSFTVGCAKKSYSDASYEVSPSNGEGYNVDNKSDLGIDKGIDTSTFATSQLIIYTYNYSISSKEIDKNIDDIVKLVYSLGGYIERNNNSYYEETSKISYANYVFRVPTDKLDSLNSNLSENYNITHKELQSTNITEKYTSNEARIQVLNSSRAAYLKLLEDEDLTYSEIIQINDKINNIDTELLNLELMQNRYDNLLEYSTVNINFRDKNENVIQRTFFGDYAIFLQDFVSGLFEFIMYSIPFVIVFVGIPAAIVIPIIVKKKKKVNKVEK